jgi:hypothetical protein
MQKSRDRLYITTLHINPHWSGMCDVGVITSAHAVIEFTLYADPKRACLLATSAAPRARLMLPTGLLSGDELLVTSK